MSGAQRPLGQGWKKGWHQNIPREIIPWGLREAAKVTDVQKPILRGYSTVL